MPPKPSPKDHHITVVVNGEPIGVTLYSPRGKKKTWYAYWSAIESARSTRQKDYKEAVKVAEAMVRNGGKRPYVNDALLTDEEFIEIQRVHFGKKKDPKAKERAEKSFTSCMDAITAFQQITKLPSLAAATPRDCEQFQNEALKLPRNWRTRYADNERSRKRRQKMKVEPRLLTPDTVLRWSRSLQAAFERANRNAGKKCVRSVVPDKKLLAENPWTQFTWIEGKEPTIRQFNYDELLSLLDYFENRFQQLPMAATFVKVLFWSGARRDEVSSLKWEDVKAVDDVEFHFDVVGKWNVERWIRVPSKLYRELQSFAAENNPYVFGDFQQQLRAYHLHRRDNRSVLRVKKEFDYKTIGEWVYRQLKKWEEEVGSDRACLHVFRKTSLQYALTGAGISSQVASDARVGAGVMLRHYAREEEIVFRERSNRTLERILSAVSPEVARRYGYEESVQEKLEYQLNQARQARDWEEVNRLAQELADLERQEGT